MKTKCVSAIENNPNPPYNKAQALRLYVEKSKMDALVEVDMNRYREALEATGGVLGGVEPISRFHEAFQGPLDAAFAAAVVGLETETFLEKVRENSGLQNVGLLALDNANGSVKRDTWTSSFREIISALDYPDRVGEPPVVTQPDVIPGTVVQIPDPNLRAAVAEALGKSINAPVTVEEMETLRVFVAESRGIHDLTGLQFATNLNRLFLRDNQISDLSPIASLIELHLLWLDDNAVSDISPVKDLKNLVEVRFNSIQVSDLSPLAGLVKLRELFIGGNNISDVSPVAGLVNLSVLHFSGNNVSDLSPVAGLVKLENLVFSGAQVSDLSPVAGLTNLSVLHFSGNNVSGLSPIARLINLKHLHFSGNNVSDLSPIARLINLEYINFSDNNVSDLSPIAGLVDLKRIHTWGNRFSDLSSLSQLTKLEEVDICGAELSDLSPLAVLTGLKELYLASNGISDISPIAKLIGLNRLSLANNDISDISPLAGLTNLKWLQVIRNDISDFSPLDRLRSNTNIEWHNNPGFLKGGPKIEGPWLWVVLPDTRLDSGTDLLSEASGGRATEVGVATHGATVGKPVGDEVWTSHKLPPTGENNIGDMLNLSDHDGVVYGVVLLYSPRAQDTPLYVGSNHGLNVWLNGALIYEHGGWRNDDYSDFFPVTLQQGRNVLLVATGTRFLMTLLTPFLDLNLVPNIRWELASTTPFPRRQSTSAIPLPSRSVQKISPTWRAGSLILSSTLPYSKRLT